MWTGWDPIFEYEGETYAEMEKEAKVGDCVGKPHEAAHAKTTRPEPDFPPIQGTSEVPAMVGP